MELTNLLMAATVDADDIAAALDEMGHVQRVRATRSLPRWLFGKLYDLVATRPPVTLDHLVPEYLEEMAIVRHLGVNNLPFFRIFEKRMYRATSDTVAGRNAQFWAWLTGPGYFTIRPEATTQVESFFDYIHTPTVKPDHWPQIQDNNRGFSYFVYRGLTDTIRTVSDHVTIGKAFRQGQPIDVYFLLVREDPQVLLHQRPIPLLAANG